MDIYIYIYIYILLLNLGYKGTQCEKDIDECQSNPCHNKAICYNNVNAYTCTCSTLYLGTNCNIYNFCLDNQC